MKPAEHITAGKNKASALRDAQPKRQDLGDPESVKSRDDWQKMIAQQETNDVVFLMSLEEGRRFFWRQLVAYGINDVTFDKTNMHNTSFFLGMRRAGKWLDDELRRVSKDNYLLMLQENFEETK